VTDPGRANPTLADILMTTNGRASGSHSGRPPRTNPANRHRHRLILDRLGVARPDDCLLDMGSGPGEFAVLAAACHPEPTVQVEHSASGVERARPRATQRGVTATLRQRDLLTETELETGERGWANLAVCSEVLEHVDELATLLSHALG